MKRQTKIFLVLSVILAGSNCLFVWINYSSSKEALQQRFEQIGSQLRAAFHTTLSATETRMLQISTFISYDKRVQQLFLEGKRAVEEEGGGPGGEKAAEVRKELHTLIGPSRDKLAEQFQFRQLHFHLGPGSLSFLRAHKVSKFGDRMDDVRYTIVVANEEQIPTTGFETGRVVSGIRGVSPVTATDPDTGEDIHIGALEAGTSFQTMLSFLKENEDAHFAVLLTRQHLEENIWPDFLANILNKNPLLNGYMVEATTSPAITEIMKQGLFPQLKDNFGTVLTQCGDTPCAITSFPLRDFLGKRDPDRADVGMVLAWQDISSEQAAFRKNFSTNILIALIGFVLIEVLLFFAIRASSKKLEEVIEEGKAELKETNSNLEEQILQRVAMEKEKEKMQAQMLHTQKLESVGQLAAGIAHEINTPAQFLGTNMEFLDDSFQDVVSLIHEYQTLIKAVKNGQVRPELLKKMEQSVEELDWEYLAEEFPLTIKQSRDGVQRISKIVKAMKEFSHPGSKEKTPVNINDILNTTLIVASNEWKYVAEIERDLAPDLPSVTCLADEMGQVFLNILVNAAHAIADSLGENPDGTKGVISISSMRDEEWIEVCIKDNGRGMAATVQEHIFDPFFTTKEVGKGTGQGLAIAYSVVTDKHQGTLSCESEEGMGTSFSIRLPLV